jgi:DNA repair protein RecO (recombination protein O)
MPLRESESIILKTYNLAEADRIVVLFTRGFGMVRGVAKGARRVKSKFGSMLEPFSEIHVEYFEKEERELVSLQHADLIRSSFEAAADPESFQTYAYIADLLLTFAPPHDPNEKLYRMFRAVLSAPISDRNDHNSLKLYADVWVLRLGGFLPDWSVCGICRRSLGPAESASLGEGFQLICGSCSTGNRHRETIAPVYREVVEEVQRVAPDAFVASNRDSGDIVNELSRILGRIIAAASGRPVPNARGAAE